MADDPRHEWLMMAAQRIYAELDLGEKCIALSLISGSTDDEMLSTSIIADQPAPLRFLIPDESDALRRGGDMLSENAIALQGGDSWLTR